MDDPRRDSDQFPKMGLNGISAQVLWDDNDGFINQNGYGAIEVTISGCDGVCEASLWAEVPVIHQTAISGITNACVGEVFTYSIPYQPGISPGPVAGVDFTWHITPAVGGAGGIVNIAPNSNQVEIRWSTPGDFTISIDQYSNDLFTQTHCLYTPKELVVHVLPNLEIKPALSVQLLWRSCRRAGRRLLLVPPLVRLPSYLGRSKIRAGRSFIPKLAARFSLSRQGQSPLLAITESGSIRPIIARTVATPI